MQFSDDPCGICVCEVYVCPFKVHLFILYTQIRLLSTIILIIFVGATLLYKKYIDKSENEVYNIPIRYTGGFYIYIIARFRFHQGPPSNIVGRFQGIYPRICFQKYSPLSGLQGFWEFQHNPICIQVVPPLFPCIPQCSFRFSLVFTWVALGFFWVLLVVLGYFWER